MVVLHTILLLIATVIGSTIIALVMGMIVSALTK